MQQQETYICNAFSIFDESGNLTNEDTEAFVQSFIHVYAKLDKQA